MVEHDVARCLHLCFSIAAGASKTVLPKEEAHLRIYTPLQHTYILCSICSMKYNKFATMDVKQLCNRMIACPHLIPSSDKVVLLLFMFNLLLLQKQNASTNFMMPLGTGCLAISKESLCNHSVVSFPG